MRTPTMQLGLWSAVGAALLLACPPVVDAQEQERQIRPDTLPPEALADWFVESRDLPRGDSQRSMVEGVVRRAGRIAGDPRAEAVRARLVDEMEATRELGWFIQCASFVLRHARTNPEWEPDTRALALRYIDGPDEEKRDAMFRVVGSLGSPETRAAAVPFASALLEAVPPHDFRQLRVVGGHLVRLGEPGREELDRLMEEGRLPESFVNWIRWTRGEGPGSG
jgi:hypothetical protein